jgi:hypothetical protein
MCNLGQLFLNHGQQQIIKVMQDKMAQRFPNNSLEYRVWHFSLLLIFTLIIEHFAFSNSFLTYDALILILQLD